MNTILYYIALLMLSATAVVLTINYKKFKSRFVFYFACFICVSLLAELIGLYIWKIVEDNNYWVFNIYTFFEFNFIALIYHTIIKDHRVVKIIKYIMISFNILYFSSFLFPPIQDKHITVLNFLLISVFSILYLRQLLNSTQILNYKRHLPFWITVGFLIFYLSSIPFQFVRENLSNRDLFFIQMILIYIMHTCFMYGLLWSKEVSK